jgi:hypothetical protein
MSKLTHWTTIEWQLLKDLLREISLWPSTDTDDDLIHIVVKAGKIDEFFLEEEK